MNRAYSPSSAWGSISCAASHSSCFVDVDVEAWAVVSTPVSSGWETTRVGEGERDHRVECASESESESGSGSRRVFGGEGGVNGASCSETSVRPLT